MYVSLYLFLYEESAENFNPNGLRLAEIWIEIKIILVLEKRYVQ